MLEGHKQRKKQNKLDKLGKPQAKLLAKSAAPQATACKSAAPSAAPHLQETSKHGAKSMPKAPPTKEMYDKVALATKHIFDMG